MSDWKNGPSEEGLEQQPRISVLDVFVVFAKRKKLFVGLPLAGAVVALIAGFVMTPTYQASTKLLPPQQAQSSSSALLAQLGGVASMAGLSGSLKNPNDMYIGMMRSRTVADKLIERFKLSSEFGIESLEKTRRKLAEVTNVSSGKDGMITVEVEGKHPQLVAGVANGYVEELLRLTRILAVTEASQRRMFFEKQLEQSKDNLASVEVALKQGLHARGVISVDAESRAAVETVARLRAQISAKEIQLNSMKAFLTDTNPEYRKVSEELQSLRSQLVRLERGGGSGDATPPSPEGFENIKLLRDVKYYQMLHELLAKQYEIARLDEAKDPSIVQVLDPAIVPELPVKPKRTMLLILGTALGFVLAMFAAFIAEARERTLRSPAEASKWAEFKRYLRTQ